MLRFANSLVLDEIRKYLVFTKQSSVGANFTTVRVLCHRISSINALASHRVDTEEHVCEARHIHVLGFRDWIVIFGVQNNCLKLSMSIVTITDGS